MSARRPTSTPRGGPLPPADRPAAVPGGDGDGHPLQVMERRAGPPRQLNPASIRATWRRSASSAWQKDSGQVATPRPRPWPKTWSGSSPASRSSRGPFPAGSASVKWARRRPAIAAADSGRRVAVVSLVAFAVGQSYRTKLEQFNARLADRAAGGGAAPSGRRRTRRSRRPRRWPRSRTTSTSKASPWPSASWPPAS